MLPISHHFDWRRRRRLRSSVALAAPSPFPRSAAAAIAAPSAAAAAKGTKLHGEKIFGGGLPLLFPLLRRLTPIKI